MSSPGDLQVVVLAGGSGHRLANLTSGSDGSQLPKQFCRFGASRTLLQNTLERALVLAPAERIVPIVLESHRHWWERDLARIPEENLRIEPLDRGTGFAVLHALTTMLRHDPDARVLILPADQVCADESILRSTLVDLVRRSREMSDQPLLLGALPDRAEDSWGWIVRAPGSGLRIGSVARLVDHAEPGESGRLQRSGAMWSTGSVAASLRETLMLFGAAQPEWVERFMWHTHGRESDPDQMLGIYERLPNLDFERHVLAGAAGRLGVLALAPCGWTDLDTPGHVIAWKRQGGTRSAPARSALAAANPSLARLP